MRFWTTGEIGILKANAELGADALARLLGRSRRSVEQAASRHRISLRRPGSRRGLVLGQPRGVSFRRELPPALREELAASRQDPIARRRELDECEALCPRCVLRPASVKVSGFCLPCHLRALAEAHRRNLADLEAEESARRELWSARQELKRARDRVKGA